MENQSFLPAATKYGVFGALTMIIISLLTTLFMDPSSMSGLMMVGLVSVIAAIAVYSFFCYRAIKVQRDDVQEGYITYGKALLTGFTTIIIMVIIATIFTYIYHNFIDPDYFATMAEGLGEMLEEQNLPEEVVEKSMSDIKASASPAKMIQSVIMGSIFGLIISLIVSAALKKDKEQNILV